MVELLTYVACLLLACLAIFQLAIALGAPLGKLAWGGSKTSLPAKARAGSIVSILLYGIFAMFLLSKAELITTIPNPRFISIGMWIITSYLILNIGLNSLSKSKLERIIMTPMAFVLAIIFLYISLS